MQSKQQYALLMECWVDRQTSPHFASFAKTAPTCDDVTHNSFTCALGRLSVVASIIA